jgi:hypothetical protein
MKRKWIESFESKGLLICYEEFKKVLHIFVDAEFILNETEKEFLEGITQETFTDNKFKFKLQETGEAKIAKEYVLFQKYMPIEKENLLRKLDPAVDEEQYWNDLVLPLLDLKKGFTFYKEKLMGPSIEKGIGG